MKEMDEERYQKLCAVSPLTAASLHSVHPKIVILILQNYFSAVSDLHSKEVTGFLATLTTKLKRPTDEDRYDGCKLDSS
jgi:hypothetical protein